MSDVRRISFVAAAGADPAELLDVLGDIAVVLGAPAWLGAIDAVRSDVLTTGAGRVIVPADTLMPFCAPGTALVHEVGIELHVRPYVVLGDAPDPETPPPVLREETHADLLVYGSPTGSLPADRIEPVIASIALALGLDRTKPARRGEVTVHGISPNWSVVLDIESPSMRYGLPASVEPFTFVPSSEETNGPS